MRRKHVAFEGISPLTGTYALYHKGERQAVAAWRDNAVKAGTLIEIEVEGGAARVGHSPRMRTTSRRSSAVACRGPEARATTTTDEATFLAPLDPVSARKRAASLSTSTTSGRVYTPAPKRKFGYYALPVLWGDRLVARFDGRLERSTSTFAILACGSRRRRSPRIPPSRGVRLWHRADDPPPGAERLDVSGVPQRLTGNDCSDTTLRLPRVSGPGTDREPFARPLAHSSLKAPRCARFRRDDGSRAGPIRDGRRP
jgi:hypothetical protein